MISRLLICLTLMVGMLLPHSAAALSGLGLSGARIMVICTGDSLVSYLITEDGRPVQLTEEAQDCALKQPVDLPTPFKAAAHDDTLLYSFAATGHAERIPTAAVISVTHARAPPSI